MASIFKPKRTAVKRDSNGKLIKPILKPGSKKPAIKLASKKKPSKTNTGHGTGHKKTKKSKK